VVIGGGIGGLAAAIGLRRAGVEARVFERAPALGEVGAGLSLWPNGLRALDAVAGLGDEVRARSVRDGSGALRSWKGRELVAANGEELERLLGDVTLIIHRADLLALLRRQLPDDAVVTGAECIGFEEKDGEVAARFAGGTEVGGDVLIGADGIHSAVRAQLFGSSPPAYAGYTAWRSVLAFDHTRLAPGISIGRGCQFGQVPMANGQVYWFATENRPAGQGAPPGGWRGALLELFARWHPPIPELIAATPEAAILHNDIVDRPPHGRWGEGRVTLLGDAAHPMTPDLGQGANQALEDAQALAAAVGPDLVAALRAYESVRIPRASAIVRGSRRVGRIMQLDSRLACWARDSLLSTRAATRMQLRQLQKLVAPGAPV